MRGIGVHLGIGGGYEAALAHAKALGCTAVQIFTHSPRSFQFKPIDPQRVAVLRRGWQELGIDPVVSHCCYLINLGSSDSKAFYASLSTVRKELEYAQAFGCKYFVLHVGKYTSSSLEAGMQQVAKGLDKLAETLAGTQVMLLLETVAGQGTEIGVTFEELHRLIQMVSPAVQPHIGVCIDTCHIFAAGYDISTKEGTDAAVRSIEATFGVDRVRVIHVNDSKFGPGERKDRHEHIGKGRIGAEGLRHFLNHPKLSDKPLILETPVDEEGDQSTDMAALRKIVQ